MYAVRTACANFQITFLRIKFHVRNTNILEDQRKMPLNTRFFYFLRTLLFNCSPWHAVYSCSRYQKLSISVHRRPSISGSNFIPHWLFQLPVHARFVAIHSGFKVTPKKTVRCTVGRKPGLPREVSKT